MKKFHSYLFGRHFEITNDHKPLQSLFSATKGVPVLASLSIQRWALILVAYDYSFSHKPGKDIGHADAMRRLSLRESSGFVPIPEDTELLMEFLDSSPVTAEEIRQWTDHDPVLSRVHHYITNGWPGSPDTRLQAYSLCKSELSVQDGVILWGSRVVVPPPGRSRVLEMLHEAHLGMVRMKTFARSYVWWPTLDLETTDHNCNSCQANAKLPSSSAMHPRGCRRNLGSTYTLIVPGHFWAKCFWSLLMPIRSGWTCIP